MRLQLPVYSEVLAGHPHTTIIVRTGIITYLSITSATVFFSTITLIATHPSSSSDVTVGALLPGVIFMIIGNFERGTLYVQRTYFWAASQGDQWSMRRYKAW